MFNAAYSYTFQMCRVMHAEVRSPQLTLHGFHMLILDSLHVYTDPRTTPPIEIANLLEVEPRDARGQSVFVRANHIATCMG